MTKEDRKYVAAQFNAIMFVVEKMSGSVTTRIAEIERRLDALENQPHFERPNDGR